MNTPLDPKMSQPAGLPQLQLVVHAGPLAGKGFPITGDALTFGRGPDNDITLDDTQVSRNHARLLKHGDEVIIEDLGSTNGTLVNGKPITGQHILQPADIISIGSSVFGVRGFSAPQTIGVTQISMERRNYPPPVPSASTLPQAGPTIAPRPIPKSPAAEPSGGFNLLLIGGILALVIVVLGIAAVTAFFLTQDRTPTIAAIPKVTITAPVNGSQAQVNVPVTVQATASDPNGVKRMELWVSNVKTAEAISPVEQGQATLTASFQWTPPAAGTYPLEVKAFNASGGVSAPTVVTVNVGGGAATTTEPPTATAIPQTPTPTVPAKPSLTTKTDLNVRSGPGIQYDLLGLLPAGVTVEIIGREETRQWWQIRFSPAADGIGWVAADPAFSTTANADNVALAQLPPTPTLVPTNTPVPATFTPVPPTNTAIPPTATPTVTVIPTATNPPSAINFNITPTQIQGGECVNITWSVSGVREIYFEGQGVGGSANIVDCPKETKTYQFRIVRQDGSEYRQEIEVEVVNAISSTGSMKLEPNQAVDLDQGRVTSDGADFYWRLEGGVRVLEAQNGAIFAPIRDISDLKNLSLEECLGAPMGNYPYMDGSPDAPNEPNKIIEQGSICYRTNEGRLGKLRFPKGSSDDLRIEWLTWR
ncbi:MAG: FHA domain-containing protein [Anaerolineae bacterium]